MNANFPWSSLHLHMEIKVSSHCYIVSVKLRSIKIKEFADINSVALKWEWYRYDCVICKFKFLPLECHWHWLLMSFSVSASLAQNCLKWPTGDLLYVSYHFMCTVFRALFWAVLFSEIYSMFEKHCSWSCLNKGSVFASLWCDQAKNIMWNHSLNVLDGLYCSHRTFWLLVFQQSGYNKSVHCSISQMEGSIIHTNRELQNHHKPAHISQLYCHLIINNQHVWCSDSHLAHTWHMYIISPNQMWKTFTLDNDMIIVLTYFLSKPLSAMRWVGLWGFLWWHHPLRGQTTTGSALDGAVLDIAQILAYLVHNMSRSQLFLGLGHFGWLFFFRSITFWGLWLNCISSVEIAQFLLAYI